MSSDAQKNRSQQRAIDREADLVDNYVKSRINKLTGDEILQEWIRLIAPQRRIDRFVRNSQPINRNRSLGMINFNEGAVKLEAVEKTDGDYIHASLIEHKYGRFILAQSPMKETLIDWCRMIWQQKVALIVCVTALDNEDECYPYFEKKPNKKVHADKRFSIVTTSVQSHSKYIDQYELCIKDKKSKEKRTVFVLHLKDWNATINPEPMTIVTVIALSKVCTKVDDINPILVHGKFGVNRTGAYVIASLLCNELRLTGQISIIDTCRHVRMLRFGVAERRKYFGIIIGTVVHFATILNYIDGKSADVIRVAENIANYGASIDETSAGSNRSK